MTHDEHDLLYNKLISVAETVVEINTKMDTLIGTDVNKGRVQILEENVKLLEAHKNRAAGWIAGAGAVGGAIGAAAFTAAKWFMHGK